MPENNGQLNERKKLAGRIKRARESSHISQRALSKSLGVSDKLISSYEHARSMPPLNRLTIIALRTGKPLTFFVGEKTAIRDIASKLKSVEQEIKEIHALLDQISKTNDNLREVPVATEQL
jgi:transcriptional regulator with XRE-family HTH domain